MSNLNTKMSLFEKLYDRKPSLAEWMEFSSDPSVDDMLTTKGKESNNISELQVLKSAAGYYIGRTENGMPYSRESTYFRTSEEAKELLNLNPNTKSL